MTTRIRFNEEGEATLPKELVEGEPVGEGTILTARRDEEEGNVVLVVSRSSPRGVTPTRSLRGLRKRTRCREKRRNGFEAP